VNGSMYSLLPGTSVRRIGDQHTVIAGGSRLFAISGLAEEVVQFLEPFTSATGANLDEAMANVGAGVPDNVSDFSKMFDALVDNGLLRSVPESTYRFARAVVISRFGLPGLQQVLPDSGLVKAIELKLITNADDLDSLCSEPEELVIAVGLHLDEFYRLNQTLVTSGRPWIFADWSPRRTVVSPILGRDELPCFECVRMRRLGTVRDVTQNVAIEERAIKGIAADLTAPRTLPMSEQCQLSALVMRRLMLSDVQSDEFYIYDSNDGTVRTAAMSKIPDCSTCN
jgi:hypothetical protein